MRITSRMYIIVGLIYALFFVFFIVAFIQEPQPPAMVLVFFAIEALLALFLWGTFNCIDIYLKEDNQLEIRYHGMVLNISKTIKLRRLPFIANKSGQQFTVASFRFLDETGERKLKFFIIRSKLWHLIEGLKEEKILP